MSTTDTTEVQKNAMISPCGNYRYWLSRDWNTEEQAVTYLMMNPSTADATIGDATIRKCIGFAKHWGYGGIRVINLFAIRSRDPLDVFENHIQIFCEACGHGWTQLDGEYSGPRPCEKCGSLSTTEVDAPWDPIGPDYERHLKAILRESHFVVAAWGCESTLRKKVPGKSIIDRPTKVLELIHEIAPKLAVYCFGKSKNGTPYHPLMLPYTTPLQLFSTPSATEDVA